MGFDSRLLVDEVAHDLQTITSTLSTITHLVSSINTIALYGQYIVNDAEELKRKCFQLEMMEKEARSVLKRVKRRAHDLDDRERALNKREDDLKAREVRLGIAQKRMDAREEAVIVKEKSWEEAEFSQDTYKMKMLSLMKEEAEKKRQQYVDKSPNIIKLNVGGKVFEVEKRSIMRYPHSFLAFMLKDGQLTGNREVFIDRDDKLFPMIIHVMRGTTRPSLSPYSDEYRFWFQNDFLLGDPLLDFKYTILSWLPNKFSLLYRSSSDGLSVSKFHALCDNKGPTLCVFQSGGYFFGGYNPDHWQSPEEPINKHLPSSFLFTLLNPHNIPPTQYWTQKNRPSIRQDKDCGIIFGDVYGTGLYVYGDSKSFHFGHPGAFVDTTGKGSTTFTGKGGINPIHSLFVYSVQ